MIFIILFMLLVLTVLVSAFVANYCRDELRNTKFFSILIALPLLLAATLVAAEYLALWAQLTLLGLLIVLHFRIAPPLFFQLLSAPLLLLATHSDALFAIALLLLAALAFGYLAVAVRPPKEKRWTALIVLALRASGWPFLVVSLLCIVISFFL